MNHSCEKFTVSIIIDNYNYACFLKEAIDSALNQTYPHIEVIVVDDGSIDNSQEVIASYGNQIIPILKKNGGQSSALNSGFAIAKGEIAIFLDSDDVLLPDTVQRVVAAFQANPGAVRVQYNLQIIDANGRPTGEVYPPRQHMLDGDLRPHILKFHHYTWPPTSGNAFLATILRQILPIPEVLYRGNPDEYLNNLSAMFGSIVSLDEPGTLYRVHGKNNYYQSMGLIDLDRLRQIILRTDESRTKQRNLFNALYSANIREIGLWDLIFFKDRMVSLKLDRLNHPFKKDNLLSLCICGVISSMISPQMRWQGRFLFAFWFMIMLFVPKAVAKPLTEQFLYPEARKRLASKLLTVMRKLGRYEKLSGAQQ